MAGEIGYFVKQRQNHKLRTCAIVRGFRDTFGRESKTADLCENMDQIDQEVVLMVKRYGPRVELTCKVVLAGDRSRYEGRVLDVSLPGCLIECVHALHVGDYVQLRLFFPDQARPMDVSLAAVRWIDGRKIGVEFIRSSKDDQVRLATLVRGQVLSTDIGDQGRETIAPLRATGH